MAEVLRWEERDLERPPLREEVEEARAGEVGDGDCAARRVRGELAADRV